VETVDTSGQALLDFWKRVGDTGQVNPNTASSYRGACALVLSVLEGWQTTDIKSLDPEELFRRFVNKNSTKFKPGSLQSYSRRWPTAFRSFLEYAKDPLAWKPPVSTAPPATKKEKVAVETAVIPLTESAQEVVAAVRGWSSPPSVAGMVEYPFPLRQGRLAYLKLPVDLTAAEVKRLTAFMNTLAIEGDPLMS
jgi:hypothetical protein